MSPSRLQQIGCCRQPKQQWQQIPIMAQTSRQLAGDRSASISHFAAQSSTKSKDQDVDALLTLADPQIFPVPRLLYQSPHRPMQAAETSDEAKQASAESC